MFSLKDWKRNEFELAVHEIRKREKSLFSLSFSMSAKFASDLKTRTVAIVPQAPDRLYGIVKSIYVLYL